MHRATQRSLAGQTGASSVYGLHRGPRLALLHPEANQHEVFTSLGTPKIPSLSLEAVKMSRKKTLRIASALDTPQVWILAVLPGRPTRNKKY